MMDGGALFFLLIPLGIGLAILFRVLAGNLDHDLLREYVEQRGGTVSSIGWAPFGPGWWGEKAIASTRSTTPIAMAIYIIPTQKRA